MARRTKAYMISYVMRNEDVHLLVETTLVAASYHLMHPSNRSCRIENDSSVASSLHHYL